MFDAAIASAQAAVCVPPHLPDPPRGRLIVVGAGKASAAMARALETHWRGPLSGLVVTRHGYAVPCTEIEIAEAAHPVPDAAGMRAAQRILKLVANLRGDDLVLCLISGGGSALLTLPAEGLTLDLKQEVSRSLLASGASISEINCVRRHLSAIKGGRLALQSGRAESVKPDDPRLRRASVRTIATPQLALEAAAGVGREAGIAVHILSDAIEGEARDVGKVFAGIARQIADRRQPFGAPCILLSGGETTVTVRGNGRGGRNVEYLLSLGIALEGHPGIHALAGDTDGVDGQEEIAGAYLGPHSLARAESLGLKPKDMLANNDAHSFFTALNDSVITGPTLTNVNDFRAILIG
jgi:hydroxypyruvate reductase